ncbi:hypothetical protein ES288_D08G144300v1 [Gossypium darwinii]|uniref:Uncharacterized protein n=1 Tax=Gossypium darwinii TaxID=34276 RepID=A0A5D2BMY8_GOSDA|nr:hypothetical protein ES288_D08G144300v1 [Gossypium darwinii]
MLPKDGVYTTQLDYSERRINCLLEDGVYTAQLVYSERRINLVKANNLNGHIGSSLQEDGLLESSILQRLQQQEGLLIQQARAIPTYPLSRIGSGTGTRSSISSIAFITSKWKSFETIMTNPSKDHIWVRRIIIILQAIQGILICTKYSILREPSTFPMQQRDPSTISMSMPMPIPNVEHENRNLLSMHNETNTSSNASNLSSPKPIKNSLYDPLFEGIGLLVDPHLRMYATM